MNTARLDRPGPLLSASLMCARLAELGAEVDRLERAGVDSFHIDVMDGHFVPNLALSLSVVGAIRPLTSLPIHVHLMTELPERYVEAAAESGADVVFFHVEATSAPLRLASTIAKRGMAPGIALNPHTALPDLAELLELPHLLVMSVEPGFAGQPFVGSTPERIARLRRRIPADGVITVDGNVNEQTVPAMWIAGADNFVAGSSGLFTAVEADYAERTAALRASVGPTRVEARVP